jgi:carbamate kinase
MGVLRRKRVLAALGGNALLRSGEKGTAEEQFAHVKETCDRFIEILNEGYGLVVTHGNGPQVGNILLMNEFAEDKLPPMPLDICGAETQGMIGYMIQQQLHNRLRLHKMEYSVVTLCTQTLVHRDDPAFKHPSKPIGPYYTEKHAEELRIEKGWHLIEQIGKGFRRVVPSPLPIDIIEADIIKKFINEKIVVVVCGGGGIPVIEDKDGFLHGVEAVIDKDRTAAVLGRKVEAEILLILTDVEKVALNFGTPHQKNINKMTIDEAQKYLKSGEFGTGSMGPKVEAACEFVKEGGEKAIITSLEMAKEALGGETGTLITK